MNFTSEQAKDFDQYAQKNLGMPSIILMENAGRNVAYIAMDMLEKEKEKTIYIICGKGNNGGDGLVAARHLINFGYQVKIYLIGKSEELKGDPEINFGILEKMNVHMEKDFATLNTSDLIIDAIFGIGLSSDVKEPYKSVIEKINSLGKPVLSVDVPSGLDATSGKILGSAVEATKTVTFVAPKTGFYQNDGPQVCGKIVVADIGINPPGHGRRQ